MIPIMHFKCITIFNHFWYLKVNWNTSHVLYLLKNKHDIFRELNGILEGYTESELIKPVNPYSILKNHIFSLLKL